MTAIQEVLSAAAEALADRDTYQEAAAIGVALLFGFVMIAIFGTMPT